MEPVRPAKVEVIQNREQAIQKVVASAAKNDCIVIAGKGHEQYQESNGVCVPFSDREVVIDALNRRKVLGNCSCITLPPASMQSKANDEYDAE